jgi:DNA repair exonuclease SbcCD ATPase subunit
MSSPSSHLEIQGNLMRVPPPKELSRSLDRRRSSEETPKFIPRRSTNRPPANASSPHKTVPTKTEPKPIINKSEETDTMKKRIANLDEEIRRLKRRIEELEKDIAELQKQLKTKDKRVAELTKDNDELKKRVNLFYHCFLLMIFLYRN